MTSVSSVASRALAWLRQHGEVLLTWVVPTLFIPALRWTVDPPELRKRLLMRDLGTYTLGTAIFFMGKLGVEKLTRFSIANPLNRSLLGTSVGLVANVLFAGLAAPKVSQSLAAQTDLTSQPVQKPNAEASSQPILNKSLAYGTNFGALHKSPLSYSYRAPLW